MKISAPVEMLAEWEDSAELNSAVFAGPQELDAFLADANREAAADWIGVRVFPATAGDPAGDAIRAKVVGFLAAWRQRHGQAKLNDVKEKVLQAYARGKADPEETRRRIDALFAEAEK